MDLSTIMKKLADDIGGRFVEYSDENTIITIPLDRNRFQNVTGYLSERNGQQVVEFMSKVCDLSDEIDYKKLLEINQDLFYGKIIIYEGMIRVASAALYAHVTEDIIRDMIIEVAKSADNLEFELVGEDIH
jgi:hypothetical protein